jgi:hypothetical protein
LIYIDKVEQSFIGVEYNIKDIKDNLHIDVSENIIDIIYWLNLYYDDLKYELIELDIRLRALRDKLNETS